MRQNISKALLKSSLTLAGFANLDRLNIAENWVSQRGKTIEDLQYAARQFQSPHKKSSLSKSWLGVHEGNRTTIERTDCTLEELRAALDLIDVQSNSYIKSYIAQSWLARFEGGSDLHTRSERTLEDINGGLAFIRDKYNKSRIVTSYITEEYKINHDKAFADFKYIVESGSLFPSRYDTQEIANLFIGCAFPASQIVEIGKNLYPNNERLRTELFCDFISKNPRDTISTKSSLREFIISLEDGNLALKITNVACNTRGFELSDLEILEITSQRLRQKYESLRTELSGDLLSSLTEEGKKAVIALFGNDEKLLQDKTLADLFSYYDIKNNCAGFASVVMPEILQKIAQSYNPSSQFSYLSEVEYGKIRDLFRGYPSSIDEMHNVSLISNYLHTKVEFKPLENIADFQFGESEVLRIFLHKMNQPASSETTETRAIILQDLNAKFKELLASPSISSEESEIAAFFEKLLGLESEISLDNRPKLRDFFCANKGLLATLFMQKDGLDKFAAVIESLGDGCVANLATQFKISLYQNLITDDCDQVLMSVFQEKIATPILNSGTEDLLTGSSSGIEIFSVSQINNSKISPNGLVEALAGEFFKDGKKLRDLWEFFEKKLGSDAREILFEKAIELNSGNLENDAAKIATYLILQSTIPNILESKSLEGFRNIYGDIVTNINCVFKDDMVFEETKSNEMVPNSSMTTSTPATGFNLEKAFKSTTQSPNK